MMSLDTLVNSIRAQEKIEFNGKEYVLKNVIVASDSNVLRANLHLSSCEFPNVDMYVEIVSVVRENTNFHLDQISCRVEK